FGGWQLGGIITMSTGHPFTPILGFDNANMITRSAGDAQRPDLAPGADNNPVTGKVEKYFDDTAFVLPPSGTLGNLARNTITGPGMAQFDFSMKKRFQVTERIRLDFRSEFFNLFNRVNFDFPARAQTVVFQRGGARNSTAGQIRKTTTTSRQIQFSLRLDF
ncbi:MAG: carboxypeptidase regulatory-like domain-containing protein, partial [Terriglobia bacterium]